ncbi:MAG TPA: hypothetical protein VGB14_05530 [Acidimicrobiales bacterium]
MPTPPGRAAAAVAIAVLAVLALVPASPAGAATGVVVADRPGGRGIDGPLEVEVPADGSAVTRTLFLRPAAGAAGGPVALLVDADGPVSVELAGGGATGTAITLNVGGGQVPLRVTVASDRPGTAEASVVGRSGSGAWASLLTVRATRPPGPAVVAGAGDEGLAVTSQAGAFALDLPVYAGDGGLSGLSATVDPFVAEGGEPVEATWELDTEDVDAGGRAVLHVEADLPFGATYRSELRLAHDGVTDPPVAVAVTRTRRASTIEVTDATVERATTGLRTPAVVDHHVSVTETTGRTVQVALPRLVLHTTGEDATGHDDGAVLRVTDVTPGNAGGDRVVWDALTGGDPTFTVPGGGTVELAVRLRLPAAAASNAVTLRFAEDGAAPVDRQYTVTVRRSAWWPLACIAAGLLLSYWLRRLWRDRRGRYQLVLVLSRLQDEVQRLRRRVAVRDATEATVFDGLSADVRRAAADASPDDTAAAEARATDLAHRVRALPAWVDLWRRVTATRPPVGGFRERAAALGEELAGEREATTDDPAAAVAALAAAFDAAVAEALTQQIEWLRADVARQLDEAARAPADARLDHAAALVAAGRPEDAVAAVDEARREAAVAVSAQVTTDLETGPHPALGLSEADWAALTAPVRALRDTTRRDWLQDAKAVLAAELRVLSEAAARAAAGDAEATEAVRRAGRLVDTEPAAARAALLAALDAVAAARPDAVPLGAPALDGGAAAAAERPVMPPVEPRRREPVEPVDLPTPAELRARIRRVELLATLLAAAVALPLGLAFLYADAWTWGSLADVVAAVAWGLGVQSLAGGSFTGIPALREAIVG